MQAFIIKLLLVCTTLNSPLEINFGIKTNGKTIPIKYPTFDLLSFSSFISIEIGTINISQLYIALTGGREIKIKQTYKTDFQFCLTWNE